MRVDVLGGDVRLVPHERGIGEIHRPVQFRSRHRARAPRGSASRGAFRCGRLSVRVESARGLHAAIDVEIERTLADEADAAAGGKGSGRNPTARAARRWRHPTRCAIVDGSCCASVRPLNPTCSSGKVMRPSRAARSARVADACASRLMRPLSPAGAPGMAAGSRPAKRRLERRRTTHARNLDRERRNDFERDRARRPRCVALPQFAVSCSMSAAPSATRARSWMLDSPGSIRGDRTRPLSTVSDEIGIDRLQRAAQSCR